MSHELIFVSGFCVLHESFALAALKYRKGVGIKVVLEAGYPVLIRRIFNIEKPVVKTDLCVNAAVA